jgi:hypothetical protein
MTAIASSSILLSSASPATTGDAPDPRTRAWHRSEGLRRFAATLAAQSFRRRRKCPRYDACDHPETDAATADGRDRACCGTGKRQDLAAGNAAPAAGRPRSPPKPRWPPPGSRRRARSLSGPDPRGPARCGCDGTDAGRPGRNRRRTGNARAARYGHHGHGKRARSRRSRPLPRSSRRPPTPPRLPQTGKCNAGTTLPTRTAATGNTASTAQNLQAMAAALPRRPAADDARADPGSRSTPATAAPATQPSTTLTPFPKRPRPRPLSPAGFGSGRQHRAHGRHRHHRRNAGQGHGSRRPQHRVRPPG